MSTPINQLPASQNNDTINDDDAAIQDILNQINASNPNPPPSNNSPTSQDLQQLQQLQAQIQQQQLLVAAMNNNNNININSLAKTPNTIDDVNYSSFFNAFTDDIKLATIVFISVIIVHFIPIEKIIGKYFALDKIPYHDILFRASFAATIVLFIKKFIIKSI